MRSLNSFCSIYHSFITAILFPSVQWWWAPVFFVSQLNLYTTVPDTEKMLVNIDQMNIDLGSVYLELTMWQMLFWMLQTEH